MKGKSIAGLILGIVALVCSSAFGALISGWCYVIALPMAIVGLSLSATAGKELKAAGQPKGVATAGLIIGIIATVLSAITFLTCGICVITAAVGGLVADQAGDQLTNDIEDMFEGLYNIVKIVK